MDVSELSLVRFFPFCVYVAECKIATNTQMPSKPPKIYIPQKHKAPRQTKPEFELCLAGQLSLMCFPFLEMLRVYEYTNRKRICLVTR